MGRPGQFCAPAPGCWLVQRNTLRDALVAYAKTVKVGDGSEQGTQIGPINNRRQRDKIAAMVEAACGSKRRSSTTLRAEPRTCQRPSLP